MIESYLPHGDRLGRNKPNTIIIHAMAEYINGSGWKKHAVHFLDKSGLSAHLLGAPDGKIYRCREDNQCAYHAKGFNTNSLGYEFLLEGEHNYSSFLNGISTPYLSDIQYNNGVAQIKEWMQLHDIKNIVRHSDLSPERKVDPGEGFPWLKFLHDIGG